MKIFQVVNNICHYDATRVHPTLESTVGKYPSDVLFVETPDNVFEGWGYMDGEFIQPEAPEGWLYDEKTGTFYPADGKPRSEMIPPPVEQRVTSLEEAIAKGLSLYEEDLG